MATTPTRTRSRFVEVMLVAFGVYSGLHGLSHILDTHHHAGDWVGLLEFAGLVVATVLFAIALRYSVIDEKRRL